jgi:hypothetical protein
LEVWSRGFNHTTISDASAVALVADFSSFVVACLWTITRIVTSLFCPRAVTPLHARTADMTKTNPSL